MKTKWLKLNLFLAQRGFELSRYAEADATSYTFRNSTTDGVVCFYPDATENEAVMFVSKHKVVIRSAQYRVNFQQETATEMWSGVDFSNPGQYRTTALFSCLESILS